MENQTENTNVTTENKPQSEPLHKSFCRECGTMISEKADICPNCGATQHRAKVIDDTPSAGLESIVVLYPSCRIDFIRCTKQGYPYLCQRIWQMGFNRFLYWYSFKYSVVLCSIGICFKYVQSIYLIFKFVVTTLSAHRQSQLHFSLTMWAERLWNLL